MKRSPQRARERSKNTNWEKYKTDTDKRILKIINLSNLNILSPHKLHPRNVLRFA